MDFGFIKKCSGFSGILSSLLRLIKRRDHRQSDGACQA
jgi:hypothetical protein